MTDAASDARVPVAVVTPGMMGTHQIFRREFPLSADLAAKVADGDTARAARLGDHVRLLLDLVGVHHQAEDTYLWALLPERTPASAEIVATMLRQHDEAHANAEALSTALDAWTASVTGESTSAVVGALGTFTSGLLAHADLEEAETIPFIAQSLTPEEWGAFVQFASTAMPQEVSGTVMGMMLEGMSPEAREGFLGHLPEQFAQFLRTTGAEQYAAYVADIRQN